jgi:SNF2 family DNA or RNA helicase
MRQEARELEAAELSGRKTCCPLFAIHWMLIVLEEAHKISNQHNTFAQAAYRLIGSYRLALTGTPMQNEYSDYQSLMKFLQIQPWADARFFKDVC